MHKTSKWDFWGIVISGLCVVHCLAIPILIFFLPVLGLKIFPQEDLTHVTLLAFILGVAGVSFVSGFRVHGKWQPVIWLVTGLVFIFFATFFVHRTLGHTWEPVIAIVGSLCLIRAHYLNHKCKKCEVAHTHSHH